MANIVIIGAEANNNSSINLRSVLTSAEPPHTCTLIAEASTAPLSGYDLIITTRVQGGVNANTNIVDAFNSGVPVICGMVQSDITSSVVGGESALLSGKIGLSSSSYNNSNYFHVISTSNDFSSSYPVGTTVSTHSSNEFHGFTPASSIADSAKIYFRSPAGASSVSVAIAEAGAMSLLGTPFPASCALAGFLYSSFYNYTPAAAKLIREIVDAVLLVNKQRKIKGYSLKENGDPEQADVYIYKHSDGGFLNRTRTGLDGSYSFTVGEGLFFLVCDNGDVASNLKVIGRVEGIL